MARPLRLDQPGLTHHITARGNNRKKIFRDDADCMKFLELLGEAATLFNWIVYSWVLMINHYHLVIETPEATLSDGMQWLNFQYAQYVNRRHKRCGHVFQGRFHSFLVDKEAYLLEVLRYVALNPVRSRLAARPEDYRWSSYRATAGFDLPPVWLNTATVLSHFGDDRATAQSVYGDFVCEKIGSKERIWDKVVNQIYLGTEPWIERMRELVESKPRSDEHPLPQRAVGRPAVHKVVDAVAIAFGIRERDVRHGHGGAARMLTAWLARHEGLSRLRAIRATLRLRSTGYVSDLVRACEKHLSRNEVLRELADRCLELLRPLGGPTPPLWPAMPLPLAVRESAPVYLA